MTTPVAMPRVRMIADLIDGGPGRLVGTTAIAGTPDAPVRRRVRLFAEPGSRPIRETWSDPVTGQWQFDGLSLDQRYTALSYDHTGTHTPAASTGLVPTRIPGA